MTDLPEELGIEVEALEHLYGDGAFTISSEGSSTTVEMPLLPRQLDGDHEAYVAAKLVLKFDNSSYPTTAATAILEDSKGLTDAACIQLQQKLQSEAINLAGEMVLGHLCELALDLLTEANHPNGTCIFCLENLLNNQSSNGGNGCCFSSYQVLKLPCFHCFHIPCFTAWFQWQQAAAATAAAETTALPGQPLPPAGQDIQCEQGQVATNVFAIKCPSCRLEVQPIALRHALSQLMGLEKRKQANAANAKAAPATPPPAKTKTKTSSNDNSLAWSAEHPKTKDVLSPQSLQQLREMQTRFKRILDLQKACNGLVQENVAVSVAELEAAAAEKRQQQQQQAEENKQESTATAAEAHRNSRGGGRSGSNKGRGAAGRGRGSGSGGGGGRGRGRGKEGQPTRPPPPSSSSK